MNRSEQNRKAANTRWDKHRENMRVLEELRNEVASLEEANNQKDKIIERQAKEVDIWLGNFNNSERIKKDCQRENISLLTDKKVLTNLCYALERQNKVLKTGVVFLVAVAGSLGVYISYLNLA